jgi:hypothetical protein
MSEMIELFGVPNFLAAYNAGPAQQRHPAQIGDLPVGMTPPGELPAPQSLPFATAASKAPRSSPQMTSGSAFALRMIGAPVDEGQRRCPKVPKEDRSPERALCAEVEQSLCNACTLHQAAERPKCRRSLGAVRSARARSNAALG